MKVFGLVTLFSVSLAAITFADDDIGLFKELDASYEPTSFKISGPYLKIKAAGLRTKKFYNKAEVALVTTQSGVYTVYHYPPDTDPREKVGLQISSLGTYLSAVHPDVFFRVESFPSPFSFDDGGKRRLGRGRLHPHPDSAMNEHLICGFKDLGDDTTFVVVVECEKSQVRDLIEDMNSLCQSLRSTATPNPYSRE